MILLIHYIRIPSYHSTTVTYSFGLSNTRTLSEMMGFLFASDSQHRHSVEEVSHNLFGNAKQNKDDRRVGSSPKNTSKKIWNIKISVVYLYHETSKNKTHYKI